MPVIDDLWVTSNNGSNPFLVPDKIVFHFFPDID